MMMRCKEVSHLVASGEADDLGFMKRLELRLHLMMCRHCANYARQIRALGDGVRRLAASQDPPPEELRHLEDRICDHLSHDRGKPS